MFYKCFQQVNRMFVGVGKKGGRSNSEVLIHKYGNITNTIKINKEAVKNFYYFEKGTVKKFYQVWYKTGKEILHIKNNY